jgi:CheY-like chemotaxis protein
MTAKLLLADDSVTIQRVIELTFADENVQVVAVGDGKEAIERVQSERPDIVLADIGMPERDGYEVAAFIKGSPELAHIPVLLLTGAFEPIDESRAKSVGCEGVLVKPFEPQMVISRVRELLGKKPRQAEAPAAGTPAAEPLETPPPAAAAAPAPVAAAPAPAPPAPAAQTPGKSDALENYFDRLDAALSTVNTAPPPLEPVPEELRVASTFAEAAVDKSTFAEAAVDKSTFADAPVGKPGGADAPAPKANVSPAAKRSSSAAVAATAGGTSYGMPPLHEAFTALLSAERGAPLHPNGPTREAITDEVIEEVVRRVLARMSNDTMRRAVLDAAERMVREEIDRIKKTV